MRDSFTSMHIFNIPHEKIIAALLSYFDVHYLERQIEMLRGGKKLTPEEDRKMFHYLFRLKGDYKVFLGESNSSMYMDIGPCPDIENYARDISGLTGGTVLFYSTFENDPVECGVCQKGETITMLVRGNGRDRELVHKEMNMKNFYAVVGTKSIQSKINYNRVDKDELAEAVERDCRIFLREDAFDLCRKNNSITQIYEQVNLAIFDTSIRSEEDRKASIKRNKIPVESTEEDFMELLLSAIAVGFLSIRERGTDLHTLPSRGSVILRDLMNLYETDSSSASQEVLDALLSNDASTWTQAWINDKKTQILDRY